MSTLLKIKSLKRNMTKTEKKIANYFLKNLSKIKDSTTYEIAEACNVSQASIVRFSKKLDFLGFPDFKISLVQEIEKLSYEHHISVLDEDINSKDSVEIVCKKIVSKNINALNNTLSLINTEDLKKVLTYITKARKIMLAGVGFSGIVAKDFSYKLSELGINTIFEIDLHMQFSYLATMNKNDLLFVISYSGRTNEIIKIVEEAKKRNIFIISLTTLLPNPVRKLSNISLNTIDLGENIRATSLSPRISQFTVIDCIYANLILKNKKMEKYIIDALDIVKNYKIK